MKGLRFPMIEEIKTASLEEKCFEDWKKCWHKCIISEGDYFEGDNIGIDEKIKIQLFYLQCKVNNRK